MIEIDGIRTDMIANNLQPSRPVHPGEIIKEELESRGIPQKTFAAEIGISPSLLSEMLNGKRAVSIESALLFEAALNIDADIWIRLQADYNKQIAKSNSSLMKRIAKIRQTAAFV
jgi:addiction module HigA family antidote